MMGMNDSNGPEVELMNFKDQQQVNSWAEDHVHVISFGEQNEDLGGYFSRLAASAHQQRHQLQQGL